MRIGVGGNVGIGTTAPSTKVHVSGGVLTVDGTGAGITTTGNVAAATFIGSGASLTGVPQLSSTQTFTGASTFASTTAFTATNATLPGVDISSGLIVHAGNVGIGTVAPSAKLHISSGVLTVDGTGAGITTTGNVTASSGTAAAPAYSFGGDLDTGIYSNGANSVSISAGGSEKMRIFSNGNMAFDDFTNMPGAASSGTYKVFHFASPTNGGSTILSMASRNLSTSFFGNYMGTFVIGNEGTFPIDFKTGLSYYDGNIFAGGTTAMRITGAGNVGIGTTAPNERLDVGGADPRIYLGDAAAPSTTANRLYSVSGSLYWNGTNLGALPSATEGYTLRGNGATWAAASSLFVKSDGNVGIGTTEPGAALDVAGTAQLRGAAGGTGLYVDPNGNVGIGTTEPVAGLDVVSGTSTAYSLAVGTSTAYSMVVSTAGNVGIGTTNPVKKLEIAGATRMQFDTSNAGYVDLIVDGNIVATMRP